VNRDPCKLQSDELVADAAHPSIPMNLRAARPYGKRTFADATVPFLLSGLALARSFGDVCKAHGST
jgi:hypothetical protein